MQKVFTEQITSLTNQKRKSRLSLSLIPRLALVVGLRAQRFNYFWSNYYSNYTTCDSDRSTQRKNSAKSKKCHYIYMPLSKPKKKRKTLRVACICTTVINALVPYSVTILCHDMSITSSSVSICSLNLFSLLPSPLTSQNPLQTAFDMFSVITRKCLASLN
jgi:hypothetical protein